MIYLDESAVSRAEWASVLADHLSVEADSGDFTFPEGSAVGTFTLYQGDAETYSGDITLTVGTDYLAKTV